MGSAPLSDVLQQHVPKEKGMPSLNYFPSCFCQYSYHSATFNLTKFFEVGDVKPKYILHQHVCTSIKLDIVQDLIDSIAFYKIYTMKRKNKFVSSFFPSNPFFPASYVIYCCENL